MPSRQALATKSSTEMSRLIVVAMAVAAGVGGALSGCHPTGTPIADVIETTAFAAGFTLLASRSSRGAWLVVGVAAVVFARGWLLVPALATMGVAAASVFESRFRRWIGTVVGVLGVQVVLRWPPAVFHGLPTLVASALVAILAASAWRRSSVRTRRRALFVVSGIGVAAVVLSLPIVVATLLVRGEATAGEAAAKSALSNVGGGRSTATLADLDRAATDTADASSTLSGWITAGARVVPLVAQQARFLTGTLTSAAQTAAVGVRQEPAIDYHRLGYHDGKIDLARLSAMKRPMSILDRQLRTTQHQLAELSSPWLAGPLADRVASLRAEIGRAQHSADLAVEAAKVLPAMLGGDGVRHYFIAFMSPSESRGYDGFVGSYGLLTADDGHVSLTQSGQPSDLEALLPPGGATLRGVPGYLARYGQFDPGEYIRDATLSPDLPTVANVLSQQYVQAGGVPVDGVLAIDPYGLAALLRFTGPIQVPGLPVPLTSQNAAYVLLKEQYTTFDAGETNEDLLRHDFLEAALHVAFDKLVNGSLPAPKALAAALDPAVVQGRISFWSFHRNEQPLLRRLGIGGSFPATNGGDLLAVTTQNAGGNKIDAFLHTSVLDHVTFNPSNGDVASEVTITLTNDAPATGLPPIVINSGADPDLAPGTNRTWLTLYTPLVFEKASIDGGPETMSSGVELGVKAYSNFVDVPSGATVTLRVHLMGQVASRGGFTMSVRLQPAANPEHAVVEVTPAGAWKLATTGGSARWNLSAAMSQRRVFRFVPN
jgi:hypothetical protein